MRTASENTKSKFILAAITEAQEHGIADFSVRRVAERCGTSPGAPYRHFEGKNGLILEMLRFINERWYEAQSGVLERFGDCTPQTQLVEISMEYIRFLCTNPEFQTILMLNDSSMSPEQLVEKARISDTTMDIIRRYCASVGMSKPDEERKTYAVRSFIFGAAIMINSGYMPFCERTLGFARNCIEREFGLQ